MPQSIWEPPAEISRAQIVQASERVLGLPDLPLELKEDIFRLHILGFDWDIGGKVYAPRDSARVAIGADGKKAGIFLLHGGAGDHRVMEPLALLLAGKFGYHVATLTYPGQLYLLDSSRAWPGDTINPDGTARTPIWQVERTITSDQYELIEEKSDPKLRARHGTFFLLRAKEGTEFYFRLAACPMVYEEAMKAVCHRNFPADEYSVYVHGHSTGGPQVHSLLQRMDNIAGLVGTESSPFGYIFSRMLGYTWPFPFNYMTLRTWRDKARYRGPEAGPDGCWRLPQLMEEVFEEWEATKHLPQIKFQDLVQFGAFDALEEAARVTARRLSMSAEETQALVQRYRSYPRELSGPGVKPVPPLLYGITIGSMDHRPERYRNILLPALAAMNPPPKARLVIFQAGVHTYLKPEPDLPQGVGPAMVQLWHQAITGGYYVVPTPVAPRPLARA